MKRSAEIIPFPAQPAQPVCAATNDLAAAFAEQHAALMAWRDALDALAGSLRHLGCNLQHLETAFDRRVTL